MQKRFFEEQKKYFEKETRPWLAPEPQNKCNISNGRVVLSINLSNSGKTPAYNIIYCSVISLSKEFPENEIEKKLKLENYQKTGILFPGKLITWEIIWKPRSNGKEVPRGEIIEAMKVTNWYVHLYLNYKSESMNYFHREGYNIRYEGVKNGSDIIGWYHEYNFFESF